MNTIKIRFLIIFSFAYITSFAQKDSSVLFSVSIVPQYLVNQGLRLDFDVQIAQKNWLLFSLQGYSNDNTSTMVYKKQTFKSIIGLGSEIYIKQFLKSRKIPYGFYWAAGLTTNYFRVNYPGTYWEKQTVNGLEFLYPKNASLSEPIVKIGVNAIFGAHVRLGEYSFMDFYMGYGYRKSFFNALINKDVYSSDMEYGYNYSGVIFLGGLRFGVFFGETLRK